MRERYTPKQIEKYRRQKYITHLEKIGKNLFRMLREQNTTRVQFLRKFSELIKRLDEMDPIRLDTEYHRESESYVRQLYQKVSQNGFSQESFEAMREAELSKLNRLQKMKNQNSYKKQKHRSKAEEDGWI